MVVRWTQPAADDLLHISDYTLENFGPEQARKVALTIVDAADGLREFPRRGRPGRKPHTRELPIAGSPFVLIYSVRDSSADILRILHGAQEWR